MLREKSILIVEDNVYLALDLSLAVEEANGRVVGPAGTVAEALRLLEEEGHIAAAVLDARLADLDVTPVVIALAKKGVPYVIHSGTGLPAGIAELHPDCPVLVKPLHSDVILACLRDEMKRSKAAVSKARG